MTIMLDSGVRCGADIVTARCLGAQFVFVGRWTLYGVTAGGQPGAHHAVAMIRTEVETVMRQIGAPNADALGQDFSCRDRVRREQSTLGRGRIAGGRRFKTPSFCSWLPARPRLIVRQDGGD